MIPLSLPLRSGKILVMAVAEPVEVGARFMRPLRARRKSAFFAFGASMIVCVLVTACTVVMHPCLIFRFSWTTFTRGARQLVVQEAAVITVCFAGSYRFCNENNTHFLNLTERIQKFEEFAMFEGFEY
jgi:hypothetical protein